MTPDLSAEERAAEEAENYADDNAMGLRQWCIDDFLAGVAYRDQNPGPEVLKLVEACEGLVRDYVRAKDEVEFHKTRILHLSPQALIDIGDALSSWRKVRGGDGKA